MLVSIKMEHFLPTLEEGGWFKKCPLKAFFNYHHAFLTLTLPLKGELGSHFLATWTRINNG